MKTKLKLKNAIKVDGKAVKELQFDSDLFTLEELSRANKLLNKLQKEGMFVQETDPDYHLIIARLLAEKTSKNEISYEDLSRIKGADLFALARVGRDFLLESVEVLQENTDEELEPTAEYTDNE